MNNQEFSQYEEACAGCMSGDQQVYYFSILSRTLYIYSSFKPIFQGIENCHFSQRNLARPTPTLTLNMLTLGIDDRQVSAHSDQFRSGLE